MSNELNVLCDNWPSCLWLILKKIRFKTIAPLSQESNEYFPFYFVFQDVNYRYFAQYLRVSILVDFLAPEIR
jgi:hypothetical protein